MLIEALAIFLVIFDIVVQIMLFVIKVKILALTKGSCRSLRSRFMIITFWSQSSVYLIFVLGATPKHIALTLEAIDRITEIWHLYLGANPIIKQYRCKTGSRQISTSTEVPKCNEREREREIGPCHSGRGQPVDWPILLVQRTWGREVHIS